MDATIYHGTIYRELTRLRAEDLLRAAQVERRRRARTRRPATPQGEAH